MLKFLFFAALAYLVYRMFLRPTGSGNRMSGGGAGSREIDEMVQDPVCKTYVPLRDAHSKSIGGKEYFFCSDECARRFEERVD